MDKDNGRTEHDSMGPLQVPAEALWGAQTQRAVNNFPVSGRPMPARFIAALGLVKSAAARINGRLGALSAERAQAIDSAATEVAANRHDAQFPVDIYQTGSGTSSNMNANEVIASLANRHLPTELAVHPNDHVNYGQSSNDVIPTTLRVAAVGAVAGRLLPALAHLSAVIGGRAQELQDVVKTGRTHLMDAMPLTFGQEFGAWAAQLDSARLRFDDTLVRLRRLPLGGTAVGTGVNADPRFAPAAVAELAEITGQPFVVAPNLFEGLACQDDAVELSGQLNVLAVALMKIANDLRWMNSGPLAGLGEIALPALQPGSSIMPGKVNPVVPESVVMVCAQVMGLHVANTVAGQAGNFQLNVTLPLLAANLLEAVQLLASACRLLADQAIAGLTVRREVVDAALARNPILVTALNPIIGYEKAAAIAKQAYAQGRPVLEVALEQTDLGAERLQQLLDPVLLAHPGRQAP